MATKPGEQMYSNDDKSDDNGCTQCSDGRATEVINVGNRFAGDVTLRRRSHERQGLWRLAGSALLNGPSSQGVFKTWYIIGDKGIELKREIYSLVALCPTQLRR